jgi:epoxyqueuosine reductase
MDSNLRDFLACNGADYVGFTSAEPFSEWNDAFQRRLREGTLPAHYRKRLKDDPREFLATARTLIVFGVRYPGLADVTDPGRGSVAGIAGARKKERALSSNLERFLEDDGFEARDVTGIPAKAAAVRAGIATRRKNSLAYFEGGGSAVRIGVVATDFEPEESPEARQEAEACGNCTLCLESCPTGALAEEYVVDAPRCLCYVLEHDSELPGGMRPAVGNRLVGCETCQLVCPLNREVPRLSMQDLPWLELLRLAADAVEGPEDLLCRFRDELELPMYSDYTLLRSIVIALGNWGDERSVPFLRTLADSRYPEVAEAARWSLERFGG